VLFLCRKRRANPIQASTFATSATFLLHPFFAVLGFDLKASRWLGNQSTTRAMPPTLSAFKFMPGLAWTAILFLLPT
jgi:hypothetical protein